MKKAIKSISFISFMFVLLFIMVSCSNKGFYQDFHSAGAIIEKENIFEQITLDQAKTKKENNETFVLLYGNSTNSACVSVVTSLQAQAEYLGNTDVTIYFLNSTEYKTSSQRKEVRDAIRMHEPTSDGAPVIMTFVAASTSSRVDVDTSDREKVKTKEFIKNGSIQYSSLASYIFKELFE